MFCSRVRVVDKVTTDIAYGGMSAMERLSTFKPKDSACRSGEPTLMKPYGYIRDAESALRSGNRPEAIVLIALAYLAFDLVNVDCDEITAPGIAWLERNS